MFCPACSEKLNEVSVGGVLIDICESGCGGVWFDRDELAKLDEVHEPAPNLVAPVPGVEHRNPFPRKCPRCDQNNMAVQYYDSESPVEIDACWQCGGIWLDRGELEQIRISGSDREAAGNAIIRDGIGLQELAKKYPAAARRPVNAGIVQPHREETLRFFKKLQNWLGKAA